MHLILGHFFVSFEKRTVRARRCGLKGKMLEEKLSLKGLVFGIRGLPVDPASTTRLFKLKVVAEPDSSLSASKSHLAEKVVHIKPVSDRLGPATVSKNEYQKDATLSAVLMRIHRSALM
jgi:hypothetical protein